jgi:hypothetical protein
VLITGGGGAQGGTNNLENMLGLMMIEKLTGKKFEIKEKTEEESKL